MPLNLRDVARPLLSGWHRRAHPRLRRVTDLAQRVDLRFESVPGSHSNVTSSADSHETFARSRRRAPSDELRNEGVPPPK
jgi:hypothetical protein